MTDDPVITVRSERPSIDAVKATAGRLAMSTTRVEIEPHLGYIVVTAYGAIREIVYSPDALRRISLQHVARATVSAAQRAEMDAVEWREREFRRIGSFIR